MAVQCTHLAVVLVLAFLSCNAGCLGDTTENNTAQLQERIDKAQGQGHNDEPQNNSVVTSQEQQVSHGFEAGVSTSTAETVNQAADELRSEAITQASSGTDTATTSQSEGDSSVQADVTTEAAQADVTTEAANSKANSSSAMPSAPSMKVMLDIISQNLNATEMQRKLDAARHQLTGAFEDRNVTSAVSKLRALAATLDIVLPRQPYKRPFQNRTAAEREAWLQRQPNLGDIPLPDKFMNLQDTGLVAATDAEFILTILRHSIGLPGGNSTRTDTSVASTGASAGSPSHAASSSLGYEPPADSIPGLISTFMRLASAGSIKAALALADRFYTGQGVPLDCKMGSKYARLAATAISEQMEKDALFPRYAEPADLRERHMIAHYKSQLASEHSEDSAMYETDQALRGDLDAQNRVAYRKLVGRGLENDPEAAFRDFQAGAARGDPYSIFNLGYMYARGIHVAKDVMKARELFMQSAKVGFAPAYNGIGVMAWLGEGGEANTTLALEMFQMGAKMNHADALYNLASMYHWGVAVNRSLDRAVELYQQADQEGHWKASLILAYIHHDEGQLVNKTAAQSCSLAEQHYRQFIKKQSPWNTELLKAELAEKDGDDFAALLTYMMTAEQGSDVAAMNAAFLLSRGRGYAGPGFLDLSARYIERAARQKHVGACIEMGHLIHQAEKLKLRFDSNFTNAVLWWQIAANRNSSEAHFLLGWVHHLGLQGPNATGNVTRAEQHYRRSIHYAQSYAHALPGFLGIAVIKLDQILEAFIGNRTFARFLYDFQQSAYVYEAAFDAQVGQPATQYSSGVAEGLSKWLTPVIEYFSKTRQSLWTRYASKVTGTDSDMASVTETTVIPTTVVDMHQDVKKASSNYTTTLVSERKLMIRRTLLDFESVAVTLLIGALTWVLVIRRRRMMATRPAAVQATPVTSVMGNSNFSQTSDGSSSNSQNNGSSGSCSTCEATPGGNHKDATNALGCEVDSVVSRPNNTEQRQQLCSISEGGISSKIDGSLMAGTKSISMSQFTDDVSMSQSSCSAQNVMDDQEVSQCEQKAGNATCQRISLQVQCGPKSRDKEVQCHGD